MSTIKRDPIIYHGIVNPKGEKGPNTTFYTESQLKALAPRMKGIPVKILHIHKKDKTQTYPNAGTILHANVHPSTGKLHAFFYLNDTPSGRVAQLLTGEKPGIPAEKQMNELSMGYSVMFQNDVPVKNCLNEVSLCWEGDREGTKILHKVPLSKIANVVKHVKSSKAASSRPFNQNAQNPY